MGLAALHRPELARAAHTRLLDGAVILLLSACALQVLPLPRTLVSLLSPAALPMERAFALVEPSGLRPLSIRPVHTLSAGVILGGICLLFFTARRVFDTGGVRTVSRVVALTGLVLAAVALAQNATARGLMYWRFAAPREGPAPFGPFTNRNHFATWAILGLTLSVGYLAAHAAAHPPGKGGGWRARILAALDARAWMLVAASMLLIVATAVSLSRSGIIAITVALISCVLLMRSHTGGSGRSSRGVGYAAIVAGAGGLGVLTQVGPGALHARFGAAGTAVADRLAIWHDTLPVMRDFWLAGTGAGTFQTAMAVYQRSRPEVIFNQAHNHYLQVAAEGGILMGLPALLALGALVKAGRDSLRADRSPMYFVRAGAAAGLLGIAVQSVWETGLTIPANAALAAVVAAVLVHRPARGLDR